MYAFVLVVNIAYAGGRPLFSVLSGTSEVPGPGDPDGSGGASITLNQGLGQVCFELSVENIGDITIGAHIHLGSSDVAGPVVVALVPPVNGSSEGCVDGVDPELIMAIRQNPQNYYVNVHTSVYPAGAVRGQLSK